MDNIVNHLAPTLMGLLPNQIMEERGLDNLLIRRQQILGPGRFTMLIRCMDLPTRHLCGYVLVPESVGHRMKKFSGPGALIPITYAGFGTRDIAWRWFNSSKKLTTPGKVTPDGEQDYWVGFDLQSYPRVDDEDEGKRTLALFERAVRIVQENSQ